LDKQIEGQYVDQKEPLKIPGCKSVRPEDLIDSMLDRNDVQYKEYLITANNLCKSDAILVNTWNELQHTELKALNEKLSEVPVFAVGPLVRQIESETNQDTESMMKWLEKQPKESVVYVSFGSGGTLSYDQMKELAFGLELSEQRFIWVLRAPRGEAANAAFFTTGCSDRFDEIQKQLPEGFLERIKNVGMLVQEWAPQVNVLKHPSIGCFISHCGWGSVLESLTHGVPIIAWPLYAEQSMNATLLVELGVALKTTLPPTKIVVGREEIASLVKRVILMGRNMRERVEEIKVSAEKALCEGGSSYNTLSKMAKIIKKQDLIGLSKNVHTEG
jgi:coniferyl-alcohol glucosyltransferase